MRVCVCLQASPGISRSMSNFTPLTLPSSLRTSPGRCILLAGHLKIKVKKTPQLVLKVPCSVGLAPCNQELQLVGSQQQSQKRCCQAAAVRAGTCCVCSSKRTSPQADCRVPRPLTPCSAPTLSSRSWGTTMRVRRQARRPPVRPSVLPSFIPSRPSFLQMNAAPTTSANFAWLPTRTSKCRRRSRSFTKVTG